MEKGQEGKKAIWEEEKKRRESERERERKSAGGRKAG